MKIRSNIADPVSIKDEIVYEQCLMQVIEAQCDFSMFDTASLEEEKGASFQNAQAACEASQNALTATIDAYVARRVLEALRAK